MLLTPSLCRPSLPSSPLLRISLSSAARRRLPFCGSGHCCAPAGSGSRAATVKCMANQRRVRMVAKQIQRELSDMLLTDKVLQYAVLPEASLGADRYLSSLTTISDVEVSGDLQVVKVYVSVFGDERGKEVAIAGLKSKAKYVRSELGRRMKLRLTPEIRFIDDESLERGSREAPRFQPEMFLELLAKAMKNDINLKRASACSEVLLQINDHCGENSRIRLYCSILYIVNPIPYVGFHRRHCFVYNPAQSTSRYQNSNNGNFPSLNLTHKDHNESHSLSSELQMSEFDVKRFKVDGDSKAETESSSGICNKVTEQNAQPSEPPKQDYIHVRARRGQATDSYSFAERARREKISERMKSLQDLVHGCSKIIGKTFILDEIINYIQALQHQVEFLSRKLETINPHTNNTIEGFPATDFGTETYDASSSL